MKHILLRASIILLLLSGMVPTTVWAQEVTAGEPISSDDFIPSATIENQVLEARVIEVLEEELEPYDNSQQILFQTVLVKVYKGSQLGKQVEIEYNRRLTQGESKLKVGDRLLINASIDPQSQSTTYYVIDFVRREALLSLFLLFATIVLLIGQWKGVSALLGLFSSFAIIFLVVLPGIQNGNDPLLVALVGVILIIGITFYLSHGFNEKTHWAVLGTLGSLAITAILAKIYISQARLTGFGSEEAAFLQFLKAGELNVGGLLFAGILIGALGVLDDITISQASIVKELKMLNNKLSPLDIFFKSMNVGRDHIASLVNTLILVYAGGALPLLLLFTVDSSRSVFDVMNYEIVAEEIVQTLVASIGLVLAVPVTSALASWFGFKKLPKKEKV